MGKAQAPPAEYLTGTGVAERVVTSRRLRAIALGAFLILSATPLGATPAPDGVLPNLGSNVTVQRLAAGGTAIVSPFVGAPVAAVELWYRAPSTGFGPKPVPSVARLAAQVVAASKPLVGESLGKVVNELGGRLTITVYSDSIAIAAIVPASGASSVVKAMTTSFFAPVVTDDGFGVAQRDVEQEALFGGFDPETVVRDAVFGDLFSEGPQHYPALGDPKDVSAIGIGDVRSFATRAFRAQNATLVISGVVDATIVASAVSGRSDGDAAPEAPSTAMDFIADYLFRSDDGYVAKAVAKTYPDAFLVGNFITLHDPGVMFVAYSGKDMSSLKTLVDDGFARVRKPLDARDFSVALAQFEYHIRSDLQTPTQVADNYGWYAVEGAADYAPGANGERGAYFTYANGLTPDFVASVAQKYLGTPPATITLSPTAAMKGEAQ
jgi:hypothetical protein